MTLQQRSPFPATALAAVTLLALGSCSRPSESHSLKPRISLVNSPTDILTLGAQHLARELALKSHHEIEPKVYHSGVLSGGKGQAEIEMCQQGSIEISITSTAYLANLVPKTSIISLPFLFRDIDQVIGLAKSKSAVLDTINEELHAKNLHVVAWWPRGFRQLTNSKRPIKSFDDIQGLKFRVMNNPLYVDIMSAIGVHPVPMAWGEVYNALQLKTIDGQENAEDVIFSSKLFEAQKYMTVWDYSTDMEVVMANLTWWEGLTADHRQLIQQVADSSVDFQVDLLLKNTAELRKKIAEAGVEIYDMPAENKRRFRQAVKPVWEKYQNTFTQPYMDAFLAEVERH